MTDFRPNCPPAQWPTTGIILLLLSFLATTLETQCLGAKGCCAERDCSSTAFHSGSTCGLSLLMVHSRSMSKQQLGDQNTMESDQTQHEHRKIGDSSSHSAVWDVGALSPPAPLTIVIEDTLRSIRDFVDGGPFEIKPDINAGKLHDGTFEDFKSRTRRAYETETIEPEPFSVEPVASIYDTVYETEMPRPELVGLGPVSGIYNREAGFSSNSEASQADTETVTVSDASLHVTSTSEPSQAAAETVTVADANPIASTSITVPQLSASTLASTTSSTAAGIISNSESSHAAAENVAVGDANPIPSTSSTAPQVSASTLTTTLATPSASVFAITSTPTSLTQTNSQ